jgi:hypothetical protein
MSELTQDTTSVNLIKSHSPWWQEILNFNRSQNLLQTEPIAILQIMDIGGLLAYKRIQDPEYTRTLLKLNDCNLYGELAKQVDYDIVKIYLETMISQLEALRDNMKIIKQGLIELLKSTLPYQDEYLTKYIESIVEQSLYYYHFRRKDRTNLETYKTYLKWWDRIIPGSVPYVNRTRAFIEASIKLLRDENYYFNSHALFDNSGVHSKFIKAGM